jgi:YD repeat-containing protein
VASLFGWVMVATMLWMPGREASAQAGDTEYCYASECHATLAAAEAAMDAANPDYTGLFQPKDPVVGNGAGGLRPLSITYIVPDQPATVIEPVAYNASNVPNPAPTMCAPSENARYPTLCASETALISGIVASYLAAHGGSVQKVVGGEYASPYYSSAGQGSPVTGQLAHGELRHQLENSFVSGKRLLTVRIYNELGVNTWTFHHELMMWKSYQCRVGFVGISGRHPAYVDGTQSATLDPPDLCRATVAEQIITTRLRQSSCPVNASANPLFGNPCSPATGDKVQVETDFEFAGRTFTRSYHSLRQLGQKPQFAPGWVHAYSDRISGDPASLNAPMLWTNDRGSLEVFTRVGSSNRFVAEGNAKHVLDVEPTNTLPHKYVVTSDGGETLRYFNLAGRLIRIEDRSGAWKIAFGYDNDRLATATDPFGNVLSFEYDNHRLSTIRLPEGSVVSYAYDAHGNLLSVTYQDGAIRTYHYNEAGLSDANDPHALTGISDNGQRLRVLRLRRQGSRAAEPAPRRNRRGREDGARLHRRRVGAGDRQGGRGPDPDAVECERLPPGAVVDIEQRHHDEQLQRRADAGEHGPSRHHHPLRVLGRTYPSAGPLRCLRHQRRTPDGLHPRQSPAGFLDPGPGEIRHDVRDQAAADVHLR